MQQPPQVQEELTEEHKAQLDRIVVNAMAFLNTEEGKNVFERLEQIDAAIKERMKPPAVELTDTEAKAFRFITRELKRGHSPSVREVAKAVGFRSSRTGAKVIEALISKKMLKRDEKGQFLNIF